MQDMFPPKEKKCKYTGFKENCRELVCSGSCTGMWVAVDGPNPLTGKIEKTYGCASEWIYVMAAEAARNANASNVATLTLRNMIFDPIARQRELAKAAETPVLIEDKTQ